jgi:hypothetical protein
MNQQQDGDYPNRNSAHPSGTSLLDGYIGEHEYARQRGVSVRTVQKERQLGQAPPFVVLGKRVLYRRSGLEQWLLQREQTKAHTLGKGPRR